MNISCYKYFTLHKLPPFLYFVHFTIYACSYFRRYEYNNR
nr:MAG TPA: hypothetical protein [Caudoviricetes sp.]